MHQVKRAAFFAAAAFAAMNCANALSGNVYYVADGGSDENDGLSAETPFATIDMAIATAENSDDEIRVAPGTYSTTTQWGPNLKAKLVGTGETRDKVIIQSAGTYRTLRMAAGSMVTNLTVVGITVHTSNADKGGAIEMAGGTLTDCVIRDGHSNYANARSGGNIFMTAGLVENCVISNGNAKSRGGNINMEGGTVRNCVIADGQATAWGGNVYIKGSSAVVTNCVITGGRNTDTSASNAYGGNVRIENAGTVVDCVISDGVSQKSGGNVFMDGGTISGCTIVDGSALGTSWDQGGGNIFVNGAATVSRCTVSGGTTTGTGGGIRCRNSYGIVEDCLVFGNDGGLCLDYGSAYNCTIVANDTFGIHGYTGAYTKILNCVLFGNAKEWSGTKSSVADAILNMATGDTTGFGESAIAVSESDFADWNGGDYRPSAGSSLVDGGAADERAAEASQTDLDGNPRMSGKVDVGCYEYQKRDMTVHVDSFKYDRTFAPATFTFSHAVENSADPETVVFTYNFGDGSAAEKTYEATISHVYATPGVYTVTITAESECDDDVPATMVYEGYVRVASSTVYVTPGNAAAGTFPYDTPERGYGNLKTAVQNALDGYTLLLGKGVHTTSDQVYVNKALSIRGLGETPEDVIVRNVTTSTNSYYFRVLDVANAGAFVEKLTLENGRVKNTYGGNLSISAGVVSNCVIRGGLAVADGGNAAGGGVVLAGAGTLTHCVVSNNLVSGTSNYENYAGGAVFIENGKTDGRISNCLIVFNTYVPDEGDAKSGAAGVRFGGSNDNTALENCTIAANTVDGTLKDNSAGVYCMTWYGRLRNNVVAGNYETGKAKFTSVKLDFSSNNSFTYHNNVTDDAAIADSGTKSQKNKVASAASLFKNFANGDFRLKTGSAAYNGGTLSGLALQPSVDLADNPRVAFDKIDIGCYECQHLPATVFIMR